MPRTAIIRVILWRLLLGAVTLLLVSVIVFVATQGLPGDTARAILGKDATPERLAALREQLGLNRPAPLQYALWLGGVVRGDMGESLTARVPVKTLLSGRVANSMLLLAAAAVLSIPISILIGSVTALRRDGPMDTAVTFGSLLLASLPEFMIGILLVLLFATTVMHWFPAVSMVDVHVPIWMQLDDVFMPAATLVLAVAPYVTRILRASMIEVFESDYVQLARLKGMSERIVVTRHALPNALAPTFQVIAMNLAWLAGGVVVVEYLFNYPGIGSALVAAVNGRDLPVVQAITLLIAALYVGLNLIADIATILVSPRLRTSLG